MSNIYKLNFEAKTLRTKLLNQMTIDQFTKTVQELYNVLILQLARIARLYLSSLDFLYIASPPIGFLLFNYHYR